MDFEKGKPIINEPFYKHPEGTGEWIYVYTDGFGNKVCDCSICHYRFKPVGYNYCPHCGTNMEEQK